MNIIDAIVRFGATHEYLVYGLMLLIGIVEGPILAFICGIMFRWGYFPFWPMYLVLMLGDIIGDIVWYYIGKTAGLKFVEKYGKYFGLKPELISRVEYYFHKYKHPILIISKLTTGFGFATVVLFTAGLVKIPFRRYITINILGQFVWTGLLMGAGYLFGHLYSTFNNVFQRLGLAAACIIVVVAIIQVGKYIRDTYIAPKPTSNN
jgi:membrane protein DedA with SNARE-associated domain